MLKCVKNVNVSYPQHHFKNAFYCCFKLFRYFGTKKELVSVQECEEMYATKYDVTKSWVEYGNPFFDLGRLGWKIYWSKRPYDNVISTIDNFFYQWDQSTATPPLATLYESILVSIWTFQCTLINKIKEYIKQNETAPLSIDQFHDKVAFIYFCFVFFYG